LCYQHRISFKHKQKADEINTAFYYFSSSEVHAGQRVALSGTGLRQKGHGFVEGGGVASSFFRIELIPLTRR